MFVIYARTVSEVDVAKYATYRSSKLTCIDTKSEWWILSISPDERYAGIASAGRSEFHGPRISTCFGLLLRWSTIQEIGPEHGFIPLPANSGYSLSCSIVCKLVRYAAGIHCLTEC